MIEELERELPQVTLLLGPQLDVLVFDAIQASRRHGVTVADRRTYRHVSSADARDITRFAQFAPFGDFKVVIAALDGSTAQAQNILLKVLEEPPPSVRFILAATYRPLATVVSRCRVVTVPAARMAEEPDSKVTGQVDAALAAAAAGDLPALDKALRDWGDQEHAVLSLLLAEAAADRGPDELVTPGQARRLLAALSRFHDARPRLAAHAALVTVLVPEG